MAKFKVGDKVNIIDGFFKGKKGVIIDREYNWPNDDPNEEYHYAIFLVPNRLKFKPWIAVYESQIELINYHKEKCKLGQLYYRISRNDIKYSEHVSLFKMASMIGTFPKKNGKLEELGLYIAVGDDDVCKIPHFHVFRRKIDQLNWVNGASICIENNQYCPHENNNEILTKEELEAVVERLKEDDSRFRTNWYFLTLIWNNQNKNQVDSNIDIPKYINS